MNAKSLELLVLAFSKFPHYLQSATVKESFSQVNGEDIEVRLVSMDGFDLGYVPSEGWLKIRFEDGKMRNLFPTDGMTVFDVTLRTIAASLASVIEYQSETQGFQVENNHDIALKAWKNVADRIFGVLDLDPMEAMGLEELAPISKASSSIEADEPQGVPTISLRPESVDLPRISTPIKKASSKEDGEIFDPKDAYVRGNHLKYLDISNAEPNTVPIAPAWLDSIHPHSKKRYIKVRWYDHVKKVTLEEDFHMVDFFFIALYRALGPCTRSYFIRVLTNCNTYTSYYLYSEGSLGAMLSTLKKSGFIKEAIDFVGTGHWSLTRKGNSFASVLNPIDEEELLVARTLTFRELCSGQRFHFSSLHGILSFFVTSEQGLKLNDLKEACSEWPGRITTQQVVDFLEFQKAVVYSEKDDTLTLTPLGMSVYKRYSAPESMS